MKKTIFISSTYKDLVKERKAVWELLKRYDVNIVGMEEFGARKLRLCTLSTLRR